MTRDDYTDRCYCGNYFTIEKRRILTKIPLTHLELICPTCRKKEIEETIKNQAGFEWV